MALGYEALARLRVMVGGSPPAAANILCTGASTPNARQRLESASGYGGRISDDGGGSYAEMGLGSPHTYDWSANDGSLNFDLDKALWDNHLKPWLFNRQTRAVVTLNTRFADTQTYNYCLWNSFSLEAAENSLITGSIGFTAVNRETGTYAQRGYPSDLTGSLGTGYIDGAAGGLNLFTSLPPPLREEPRYTPVPSWGTRLYIADTANYVGVTSWSLELSQEVAKFFSCRAESNPAEPRFLAVGPMTATFACEYVYISGTPEITGQTDIAEARLDLFGLGTSLTLKRMELTEATDAIPGPDALVPLALSYAVYELAA